MHGIRKISSLLRLSAALLLMPLPVFSQSAGRSAVTGTVCEEDTSQPVIQAGVQVLSAKDSSMVEGGVTDMEGRFRIRVAPGDYILQVSFIGFETKYIDFHHTPSQSDLNVGIIALAQKNLMLESSVVSAKADPVTIQADTVVYNAAAFKVADDAMLDELLKKIPGLEIDDSGNVSLYGRDVKQLLVNGKKYFGGDVKTGLKNLPAEMVENIRAYDRESDFKRLTGIDDGEEEPVLDISIKKSMMDGWRGSLNGGYGTSGRYAGRINANKITKSSQSTVIANIHDLGGTRSVNNVNKNVLGFGARGDTQNRDAGYTFASESKKLDIDGHAQYSGSTNGVHGVGDSQNIYATTTSFSKSENFTNGNTNIVKGDLSLEFKPSSGWTILVKPAIRYEGVGSRNRSLSRTFSADPDTLADPSKKQSNSTDNNSVVDTDKGQAGISATITRRFEKPGRNISLKFDGIYNFNRSHNLYDNNTFKKATSTLSSFRKQAVNSIDDKLSGRVILSYSEPFAKKFRWNTTLSFERRMFNSERSLYNLAAVDPEWNISRDRPAAYESAFVDTLSSKGNYNMNIAQFITALAYSRKKLYISAGVKLTPVWGHLIYPEKGEIRRINSNSFNVVPNITVRYNRIKNKKLSFVYRSWTGSPSLYNMLPVVNGTNPTSVHLGNPELKPYLSQTAEFNYNSSNSRKHNSFIFNILYNSLSDATSNSSEYDPETGVKTVTPKNIDGNWNVTGNIAYNKTFRDSRFALSTHSSAGYYNNVSFLYNKTLKLDEFNTTTRFMGRQTIDLSFRDEWLEVVAHAAGDYTNERSLLRPEMNRQPFNIIGGASVQIFLPWKMRIASDFNATVQRGYAYREFNDNFYLLNAEISQTILKGKGTLKLDAYDILGQQRNVVQSFSAESRNAYEYNGVSRYIMLRFIYRFKL